uniref:PAN domain-containing protein n=1 Tax=Wuchereria bancrofti TaxID=6293 RepID=A0AAF5Q1K6_WUCBA
MHLSNHALSHLHYYLHLIIIAYFSVFASIEIQEIPSYAACSNGESPVFLLQHNATAGKVLKRASTAHLVDCTDLCSANDECLAITYEDKECRMLSSIGEPAEYSNDYVLLSKNCAKSARICSSPFQFDVHKQKILVGFAREVVSADSLSLCLSACLNAFDSFGFECESVMYYPVDSECILNTEDRLDRPDLFVDELDDNVIYLDNNCAGSQCYAPYITQYIAVANRQLANELDRQLIADRESCESLCTQRLSTTANDFNCKSFMHNPETNVCILSDERSKPLGRGNLVKADGFTYYEKKCFASPRTCRNVPSFERIPQMILVGFAAFVMENVPSVTMCLDQCTNPPPETGENFECKSVMYYYNEQECILNAETRENKSELFIPEGEEFQVDYFDITCHLRPETCPNGTTLHTVRTVNAALPEGEGSIHILQSAGNSVADCMTKCYEMAPEKCRAFNFDKQTSDCDLLYVDGKTTLRPAVHSGIDLYDLHCLEQTKVCAQKSNVTRFSRYLYSIYDAVPSQFYETTALTNCLNLCAYTERCEGVNYNRRNGRCELFDKVEGNGKPSDFTDFYKNLCLVEEVESEYSAAANVPKYLLPNVSHSAAAQKQEAKSHIISAKTKPFLREQEAQRRAPETITKSSSASGKVSGEAGSSATFSISSSGRLPGPVVQIASDAVQTICNYEGIKVQVRNTEAFSGVIFVKNRYETCRVEVTDSESATLVIGLPPNFGSKMVADEKVDVNEANMQLAISGGNKLDKPADELRIRRQALELHRDCGIQDMNNGTYKSTVVVQTNNLGIPGLVTSMDQIFEVSCDYSSMLGGKVTAGANLTIDGPEASLIQPRGKIELGNPVLMQMLSGQGEYQPVLQAKLGDILQLRWEIMTMDEELDFFVRDCFAEPGTATLNAEENLQLIANGCPTPAVSQKIMPDPIEVMSSSVKIAHLQAFRFDSSSVVRITCHLDICIKSCKEVMCQLGKEQKQSWGRKKRSTANSVADYETERYRIPKRAQATTSVVVIDPLQQVAEPAALARSQIFDLVQEEPEMTITTSPGQLCMAKISLFGIFGLLFIITAVQAVVVAHYVFQRLTGNYKKKY